MHRIRLLLVLAALGLMMGEAAAQEPAAGRFITAIGDVQVLSKDGSSRRLGVRSAEIWPGESIVTGKNSLAQLRMSDGGALSVRSETQIKLDAYRYSGRKDPGDNFLVSILKGGFRTITGLIARNYRENYHVQTSTMTIGVRGTDFEVVHVLTPSADAQPGTYNRVYAGITAMQNRAGATLLVNRDQTAFVPLAGNLPPVLVLPPTGIFGKPTPPPPASPQSRRDDAPQGEGDKGEGRATRILPAVQEKAQDVAPATAPAAAPLKSMTAPLLNPIDSPTLVSPTTTTISPKLTSPATTTISPTLTSPTKTTTSPTLTSPTSTTISPTLTSPTTTTISPTLTSPTTTTISPILTAPTTTTISPTLTAPTTTTISPTLTSPTTTTIIKR